MYSQLSNRPMSSSIAIERERAREGPTGAGGVDWHGRECQRVKKKVDKRETELAGDDVGQQTREAVGGREQVRRPRKRFGGRRMRLAGKVWTNARELMSEEEVGGHGRELAGQREGWRTR